MASGIIVSDWPQACGFRTSMIVKSSPASIRRFNSSTVIRGASGMRDLLLLVFETKNRCGVWAGVCRENWRAVRVWDSSVIRAEVGVGARLLLGLLGRGPDQILEHWVVFQMLGKALLVCLQRGT